MKVSYNSFRRMYDFLREDIRKELGTLLSFDTYPELFRYLHRNEKKIGKLIGKGYPIGTSNGTTALQLSLTGLGIGKGDEVITPPNTFIATLLAISNSGATPKLVDVDQDTMLIDIDKIEDNINGNTKAIMPVHLYGQMVNMDKIRKIAKKHNLFVVEDACQAHSAKYKGKFPGSTSDAACYSFTPNKILGGISDGGMAVTRSRQLRKKLNILRQPQSNNPLLLKSLRTPAFLKWDQIAFIKCKMKYLKKWIKRRKEIAGIYFEAFKDTSLILPGIDKNAHHIYSDFVVRLDKRDKFQRYLKLRGIETDIHHIPPVHLSSTYKCLGHKKGDFPISEETCSKIISLPVNQFLTGNEIEYIIKKVKAFLNKPILV